MPTAGPVPETSEGRHDIDLDVVGTIAAAMLKRFGDGSAQVARTQLAHAAPDSAIKWGEILARLGG